jgi:uncharacterized phage-associated protein
MKYQASTLDLNKTLQAACVILRDKTQCEPIGRKRLLKLLYIADREALLEKGRTITGDKYVAMDHGPVLSELYDIMKDADGANSDKWRRFVSGSKYHLEQIADPGVGYLSKYDVRKLNDVLERFADKDVEEISRMTHEFEEYEKNKPSKGSSNSIPLLDIMQGLHMTDEEIKHVQELTEERVALRRSFPS